ncbi:hypothetical protein, partial [Acidithiobacillus thiooxidans]|uniref:hypothetical protein n=2 Tax=Acidithiobacillaceae TaxID=225058 RepID=UPI001C07AF32
MHYLVQTSGEVKSGRAERFCGKSGMAPQQNQRNNKHTISTHGALLFWLSQQGAADVQDNSLRYLGAVRFRGRRCGGVMTVFFDVSSANFAIGLS